MKTRVFILLMSVPASLCFTLLLSAFASLVLPKTFFVFYGIGIFLAMVAVVSSSILCHIRRLSQNLVTTVSFFATFLALFLLWVIGAADWILRHAGLANTINVIGVILTATLFSIIVADRFDGFPFMDDFSFPSFALEGKESSFCRVLASVGRLCSRPGKEELQLIIDDLTRDTRQLKSGEKLPWLYVFWQVSVAVLRVLGSEVISVASKRMRPKKRNID